MTNIRAIVTPGGVTKAKVTPQQEILVKNYSIGSNGLNLTDLGDVDISELTDGALLIYNSTSLKWQALKSVDNQNTEINGGHF